MSEKQTCVIRLDDVFLRDTPALQKLGQYIASLMEDQKQVVVVHGGNMEVFERYKQLYGRGSGDSSFSMISEKNMPMMVMVLAGELNKHLVTQLNQQGLQAVGLCGADAGLMSSNFLNYQHLGRVGGPPRINKDAFESMLSHFSPIVLSPLCPGPDGHLLLIDSDTTAQSIASALKASQLDFVIEESGLELGDGPVPQLTESEVVASMEEHFAGTKLVPKLQAALSAISGEVAQVNFGNPDSFLASKATALVRS